MKQTFYRFHPVTGIDANDIDTKGMPDDVKQELAAMVTSGAKFYWDKDSRVERANIEFVLKIVGAEYEFIETQQNE